MRICTLASSSSGNCAIVSEGSTHVLVDAGISFRRISVGLKLFGLTAADISGVVVTHEHSDHISGMGALLKRCPVPVFAPSGVASALCRIVPEADGKIVSFEAGAGFELGCLYVRSFPTMHDTPESVGYRFEGGGGSIAFVTDTGCVTREVVEAASGAAIAVIEANHDVNMLQSGPYPLHLKRRILSRRGHLSNDDCGELAARLAEGGARTIVLAHLSRENNTPRLALETVGMALRRAGADVGREVRLAAAPLDGAGDVYIL